MIYSAYYTNQIITRLISIYLAVLFVVLSLFTLSPTANAQTIERDSATVIMYHRFGEAGYPATNTTIEQFEQHLSLLTNGDYNIMPLPEIIDILQAGGKLADKTVAITIDDAFQSVYTQAWPRLKALNLPFTLFVATSPIDQGLSDYMSWDHIRILQNEGVTIGSQTATHPHLHRLNPDDIDNELTISNERFITELGIRPELFAYPYGEYSQFVIDIVKAKGFVAAFGQNSGIIHSESDFFQLSRFTFNERYGTIDRLQLAVDGLPLKVKDITPSDMVLTQNPPFYGFTLAEDMEPISQLRCFSNEHGKIEVTLLGRRAEVRLPSPFSEARARINCTMPAEQNRWRWFGRQFLTR